MKKAFKITLTVAALFAPAALLLIALPRDLSSSSKSTNVTGNLGGVKVSIPLHFADLVEYRSITINDPAAPKSPPHTFEKIISSFGFYVRFPDMAGQSSMELAKERSKSSIYRTPWLSVGLNAAENYYGAGSIDRMARGRLLKPDYRISGHPQYSQVPEEVFGLNRHSLTGLDIKTNVPYKENPDSEDLFIHQNTSGIVETLIICSNVSHRAAPCNHHFTLEPNMKTHVYVHYRRSQLENWHKIQEAVRKLILNFSIQDQKIK